MQCRIQRNIQVSMKVLVSSPLGCTSLYSSTFPQERSVSLKSVLHPPTASNWNGPPLTLARFFRHLQSWNISTNVLKKFHQVLHCRRGAKILKHASCGERFIFACQAKLLQFLRPALWSYKPYFGRVRRRYSTIINYSIRYNQIFKTLKWKNLRPFHMVLTKKVRFTRCNSRPFRCRPFTFNAAWKKVRQHSFKASRCSMGRIPSKTRTGGSKHMDRVSGPESVSTVSGVGCDRTRRMWAESYIGVELEWVKS